MKNHQLELIQVLIFQGQGDHLSLFLKIIKKAYNKFIQYIKRKYK